MNTLENNSVPAKPAVQAENIQIKSRWTGEILFEVKALSVLEALLKAIESGADLRGANLRGANLYGADLSEANLSGANLYGANLYGANLYGADLRGANLYGANLYGANLRGANLYGADLRGANLREANLSEAKDVPLESIGHIPVVKDLDKRILEAVESGSGTLNMDSWHTCETTHCRAGWAIHLAGEAGKVLETFVGPMTAGSLIYIASTGSVPNFYASNEEAMEDIRACAAKEAK